MGSTKELIAYRLEQAERCLQSARTLIADGDYKGAANRSYYCIFHCMRSVLALENMDFKKHSAVIAYFRQEYIKTKKLNTHLSDIITTLLRVRTDSDYDDFYAISKKEVDEQIENAEYFLRQVKDYLQAGEGQA